MRLSQILCLVALCSCSEISNDAPGPPDPFESSSDEEFIIPDEGVQKKLTKDLDPQQLKAELKSIVVHNLLFEDEEFDIAIDFVMQRGSELSSFAPDVIPYKLKSEPISGARISLRRRSILFEELLTEVCKQSGLTWRIDEGVIVFEK